MYRPATVKVGQGVPYEWRCSRRLGRQCAVDGEDRRDQHGLDVPSPTEGRPYGVPRQRLGRTLLRASNAMSISHVVCVGEQHLKV